MSTEAQWHDLRARVLSAVLMAAVGVLAIWQGGLIFAELVCLICGVMVWEAVRMFNARQPVALGVGAGVALTAVHLLPGMFALPICLGFAVVVAGQSERDKPLLFGITAWIMLGCFALLMLRAGAGTPWIIWMILVVIASDVAGYFAGRHLGGPKFWPRVSPKKTWSGTVAGWALAGLVGAVFMPVLDMGANLIVISVIVGFAGQMGDIFESAVKRRQGVKDSSNLLPGHGGVFDRFDAMLGSSVTALVFWAIGVLPGMAT